MNSANIGWLFYKNYFDGLDYKNIFTKSDKDIKFNEEKINEKVKTLINQTPSIEESIFLGNIHIEATTTYPGLILGSGNTHELPKIVGQAILGFSFDYTSGLPVISGSSIKGVLRSAFKHPEYIQELLENQYDVSSIKSLEIEIFGQNSGSSKVSQGQDIFFDATIKKADPFGKVLTDDFLAPHKSDPFKNPIPLRFVKVPPHVTFRFDFELNDGLISKEQKSKLFQQILNDLGIGAKTNVGYGRFENISEKLSESEQAGRDFKKLLETDNIQTIENALKVYLADPERVILEQRIEELKQLKEQEKFTKVNEEAQKAFDNARNQKDKNNKKKYLTSWIGKWSKPENNNGSSFILQLIEDAKKEL